MEEPMTAEPVDERTINASQFKARCLSVHGRSRAERPGTCHYEPWAAGRVSRAVPDQTDDCSPWMGPFEMVKKVGISLTSSGRPTLVATGMWTKRRTTGLSRSRHPC